MLFSFLNWPSKEIPGYIFRVTGTIGQKKFLPETRSYKAAKGRVRDFAS